MGQSEPNNAAARCRGLGLATVAWLAMTVLPAGAATFYVGNNGNDSAFPTCGPKTNPCRSISKTIALAAAGDTIIVGPGEYGDLDADGTFEPAQGEEAAEIGSGCDCMIKVDKPLTIQSRDGARVTVLHDTGLVPSVVHVVATAANGTHFGKPNKGFTIFHASTGVLVDATAQKVTVQGNIAIGGSVGFNVSGTGGGMNGVKVLDNIARGNSTGFQLGGVSNAMQRNRAVRNSVGFSISGATHTVTQNVAAQNSAQGFIINLSAGNTNPLSSFSSNAAISNASGIEVAATSALSSNVVIKKTNLFGNGQGAGNCGLNLSNSDGANTLTVLAKTNFWGASTGPGSDPADAVCTSGTVALTTSPVGAKESVFGQPALK